MAEASPREDPPAPTMTEEEEEALLAQFGTRTIYDHLLVGAAKHSARASNGDAPASLLFLTGTGLSERVADDSDEDGEEREEPMGDAPCASVALPLDVVVMRAFADAEADHFGPLAADFAARLVARAAQLDTTTRRRLVEEHAAAQVATYRSDFNALRNYFNTDANGDEREREASLGAIEGDCDEYLLEHALRDLDDIAQKAEAEVARRDFHYDPTADAELQAFRRELLVECGLVRDDDDDDSGDADDAMRGGDADVLQLQRRWRERLLKELNEDVGDLSSDDGGRLDATEIDGLVAAADVAQTTWVPIQLPEEAEETRRMAMQDGESSRHRAEVSEAVAAKVRECVALPLSDLILRTRAALDSQGTAPADALWSTPLAPSVLKQQLRDGETRIADLERAAIVEELPAMPSAPEPGAAAAVTVLKNGGHVELRGRHARAIASDRGDDLGGAVEIDAFVSQIECLIPVSELVPLTTDATQRSSDAPTNSPPSAHPSRATKKVSVAQLARRSRRREILLSLEAKERSRMRAEDERAAAIIRAVEVQLADFARALSDVQSNEQLRRREIDSESHLRHVDILTREQRQRQMVVEFLQHKAQKQAAKLESEIVAMEKNSRTHLRDMESYEWLDLLQSESAGRERAIQDASDRERRERETEVARVAAIKARLAVLRSAAEVVLPKAFAERTDADASTQDVAVIERVKAMEKLMSLKQQWGQSSKADAAATLQAITQQLQHLMIASSSANNSAASGGGGGARVGWPAASGRGANGDGTDDPAQRRLTAAVLRNHHHQLFAAAAANTSSFRHIFAKFSVPMESITHIASQDIADHLVAEPSGLRVSSHVLDLDLSGNQFQSLPLADVFSAFPQLATLRVRDNALRTFFECSDHQVTSAQLGASLRTLDLGSNRLATLEPLQFAPRLMALVAFSNAIESSAPLRYCPALQSVEVQRNKLTELGGAAGLRTLMLIDASRNEIVDISTIASCVALEALYLAHNRISSIPARLPLIFLQQLFLSENRISAIPDVMWLPMLSVLQLDSNALSDIAGLRCFPALTRLRLSFNRLETLEQLHPIVACAQLNSVAINDNPVTLSSDTSRAASHAFLLRHLPKLRELDNEPVSRAQRLEAQTSHTAATVLPFLLASSCASVALCAPWRNLRSAAANPGWIPLRLVQAAAALRRTFGGDDEASGSFKVNVRAAAAIDGHLRQLRRDYDVVCLAAKTKLHQAVTLEEEQFTKAKTRTVDQAPLPSLLLRTSDDVARSATVTRLQALQQCIHRLQDLASVGTVGSAVSANGGASSAATTAATSGIANVFVRNGTYEQRARAHREEASKRVIADFLYYSYLGLRAKRELQCLREQSEGYRLKRLAWAATVIQPRWRGAVVRMRLKRVQLDDLDDDDAAMFKMVTAWNSDSQLDMSAFGSVAAMMQVAMKHQPQVQRFAVPQPSPLALGGGGADQPRVSSAPQNGQRSAGVGGGDVGRPTSQPNQLVPHSPPSASVAGARPTGTKQGGVDSEWGDSVAMLLRKKEKKIEKARNDQLRREFITDPLKAKQRQK